MLATQSRRRATLLQRLPLLSKEGWHEVPGWFKTLTHLRAKFAHSARARFETKQRAVWIVGRITFASAARCDIQFVQILAAEYATRDVFGGKIDLFEEICIFVVVPHKWPVEKGDPHAAVCVRRQAVRRGFGSVKPQRLVRQLAALRVEIEFPRLARARIGPIQTASIGRPAQPVGTFRSARDAMSVKAAMQMKQTAARFHSPVHRSGEHASIGRGDAIVEAFAIG